ncbi:MULTISPECIES: hypothetical protein [Acidiplasma]|uniref:Uncharacterized protein n=2 Tax=Acidiplasma TaxID=507753 RepID=A0A0Q0RU65_9ARCH|nr:MULTISPECIES: hypothetical protein [Acidiplasma]KJE48957.1 hypothetical protein TZ01_06730 [Acidiplasma sp. MBA-1]KQB34038.1 hypothetical protein AOG54_05870 [Acidiplasma aeolicum]KQB35878.1 hypothetical protein AOG55_05450 [Acidiplasma cupricumulans]WMT54377.1 MAG: hypothetical protein RE470_05530 [Acidiplasma sp.]
MRVIATHEYVKNFIKHTGDKLPMVIGKCLDDTVSKMVYFKNRHIINRDITIKALRSYTALLKDELHKNCISLENSDLRYYYAMGWKFINAFKKSVIYENSLLRDRTRIIIINDEAGIYAQPDFVDYENKTIYEMKSFSLKPLPEYVRLQARVFQLAYPDFKTVLIAFPRDQDYIKVQNIKLREYKDVTKNRLLREIYNFTMQNGRDMDMFTAIGNKKYIKYKLD